MLNPIRDAWGDTKVVQWIEMKGWLFIRRSRLDSTLSSQCCWSPSPDRTIDNSLKWNLSVPVMHCCFTTTGVNSLRENQAEITASVFLDNVTQACAIQIIMSGELQAQNDSPWAHLILLNGLLSDADNEWPCARKIGLNYYQTDITYTPWLNSSWGAWIHPSEEHPNILATPERIKKKKNKKEEEEEEKDKKIVASPDAEIDAHWMKVYVWNTDNYRYLNLQRGPFYEANTRIFTPFLQHVAYLKSPTMKMNNTIKNSTHLNVSKVPDWNPAIWILITLKLLSNSERLAIPYFLRFSYLPNNSTSVRQLANPLNSGRSKGKKRRLNKTRDVFCETCWVSISHVDVQKTDKKEASLFLSLLVLQFCLSPTTFTCGA